MDDEPRVIAALADALRRAGHEVEAATDAPSALKRLEVERPDLLIADAMMAYVDGFQLTSDLRRLYPTARTRVIMLSSKAADGHPFRHWDGSVDCYAEKPFDPAELVRLADELLTEAVSD